MRSSIAERRSSSSSIRASVNGLVVRHASGVGLAPHVERVPERLPRGSPIGCRRCRTTPRRKAAVALQIELVGVDLERVARVARHDRPPAPVDALDRRAKPRDVDRNGMAPPSPEDAPTQRRRARPWTPSGRGGASGRPEPHAPSRRPAGPARRHRRPRSVRAPENPPQPLAAVACGRSMHRMWQGDHPAR